MKSYENHKAACAAQSKAIDGIEKSASKKRKLVQGTFGTVRFGGASGNDIAGFTATSQAEVNRLVKQYIISEMRPLSTVEKLAFIALVEGLSGRKLMTRKTLSARINAMHETMMAGAIQKLKNASFVCTTADLWSVNNHSYLGMTAHWINENFTRESLALACKRITGSHTYDVVGRAIFDIHKLYKLDVVKLTNTITDGASNFSKAFNEYGAHNVDNEADEESNDDEISDADPIEFHDLHQILRDATARFISDASLNDTQREQDDRSDDDLPIELPEQLKCFSHTLNLIASSDANTALATPAYGRMYHPVMGKCQGIWNAVHRSTKASDSVAKMCGSDKKFVIPCATRWNSKYDAICRMLELSDKLAEICEALRLPKFKALEKEFLREFTKVLTPFSTTLDILQGEKDCFFEMLLPKLVLLRSRLHQLKESNLKYVGPLASALLDGIANRYSAMMELDLSQSSVRSAIIAAVSRPKYKLLWVPPDKRETVAAIFKECVFQCTRTLNSHADSGIAANTANANADCEDDYGFNETVTDRSLAHKLEVQIASYMMDPDRNLKMLDKYPEIKAVFMQFNTTLPSSAPVERMFSVAGQI